MPPQYSQLLAELRPKGMSSCASQKEQVKGCGLSVKASSISSPSSISPAFRQITLRNECAVARSKI
jgi:hypothetical protein